jgi:hypothetical protein
MVSGLAQMDPAPDQACWRPVLRSVWELILDISMKAYTVFKTDGGVVRT